jgi:nucleotide-binding universal stress UspA family protein
MSLNENKTGAEFNPASDAVLEDALRNFRQSVHAWSDAAYVRPRGAVRVAVRHGWRLAVGWALGCVLAAGSVSGAVYERHHRQVLAAQAREAQQQKARQLAEQQRAQLADADLLATVDSDISRTVPAAMEPLAQLMDEGASQ